MTTDTGGGTPKPEPDRQLGDVTVTGPADARRNAAELGLTTTQALEHDRIMGMPIADWPEGLLAYCAERLRPITCGQAITDAVAEWLKTLKTTSKAEP